MNRIRRFYNQNSRGIWIVGLIIILIFVVLKLIDYWTGERLKEENKLVNNTVQDIVTDNNINLQTNKSAVTGESKSADSLNVEVQTIQTFLNNCTSGNIEEAYNMLTDECKEEMYNSVDDFYKFYCESTFKEKNMNFNVENWINSIYKVMIDGDILATGKDNGDTSVQDYITVRRVKDEYKLNINSYIRRDTLKKEKEDDNIKIEVINRDVYKDYESFDIKVKNNTGKDILLDPKQDITSMYIEDSKSVQYSSYNHELTLAQLFLESGQEKEITIKYYSSYNSSKNIQKLVFSKVIIGFNRNNSYINGEKVSELNVSI